MIFISQLVKLFGAICISRLNDIDSSEVNSTSEIFVSKKKEHNGMSRQLHGVLEKELEIEGIKGIKIFNNYLIEGLTPEQFEKSKRTIFSEAPVDDIIEPTDFEKYTNGKRVITIESKPGQYDARVDAVEQNLMLQTGAKHNNRFKKVVVIDGNISDEDYQKIVKFLNNPVETQTSSLYYDKKFDRKITKPENHRILEGFINSNENSDNDYLKTILSGLIDLESKKNKETLLSSNCFYQKLINLLELSINLDDLKMVLEYFRDEEKRDPTMSELMLIDTYWSDHCRHTTFETKIENLEITGEEGLVEEVKNFDKFFKEKSKKYGKDGNTFMELAKSSFKFLKDDPNFKGKDFIDYSVEDNAASYKTTVELENGEKEDWVIMFKNETHNSPTEVEPFGGAATCIGGTIRDTLSGRAFTFQCMRISGSKNPTEPISATHAGKLSQRAISIGAALGYASYGNQIGLATGRVQEYFHPGYVAKRFECGYVVAAVKEKNFKREKPKKGDLVIMAGGRTGRDGVGGANVSSQEAGGVSSEKAGSHVQKGNPIEERKFQRLLLNPKFTRLIKKSNDFGAGGVSVAIGELSRGIDIDLDIVAKHTKYEGLSDEELIIAESQERMSFVIAPEHYEEFMKLLEEENLEAFQVAEITNNENEQEDRLRIKYQGKDSVNLSRSFLDKNGAERRTNAKIDLKKVEYFDKLDQKVQALLDEGKVKEAFIEQLKKLENASQRGLGAGFDSSVGASTILAPFGGKYQTSPQIGMASKIPTHDGIDSLTAILSTNGLNPLLLSENTYVGGIFSIIESVSKIVALGGDYEKTWISLQEYFGKLTTDEKYGEVYAGLLGTLKALTELKIAAIGGKDSMSGTATIDGEKQNVPNTIVAFANSPVNSNNIVSAEFKGAGNNVLCFHINKDENGLPDWNSYREMLEKVTQLIKDGKVLSSSIVEHGGLITSIAKLTLGNKIGFNFNDISEDSFKSSIGDIVVELAPDLDIFSNGFGEYLIGETTDDSEISFGEESIEIDHAQAALEGTLEGVWSTKKENSGNVVSIQEYRERKALEICSKLDALEMATAERMSRKPVAIIPVFPGTNSELDTKHALIKEGFEVIEHVFYTPKTNGNEEHDKLEYEKAKQSRIEFAKLLKQSQFLVLAGGFSGGDEPDGSAKYMANVLKSDEIWDTLQEHFDNESKLTLGICNGDQALIKLGVFKDSKIKPELEASDPTLTFNENLRHITDITKLGVTSVLSPFMSEVEAGDEFMIPNSHGEGNYAMSEADFKEFETNGQIALQYKDENGNPTNKYNGSYNGVAGLTSKNGRIFGMMSHIERNGKNVFKNIPGEKLLPVLKGAYKALKGIMNKELEKQAIG